MNIFSIKIPDSEIDLFDDSYLVDTISELKSTLSEKLKDDVEIIIAPFDVSQVSKEQLIVYIKSLLSILKTKIKEDKI